MHAMGPGLSKHGQLSAESIIIKGFSSKIVKRLS